MGLACRGWLVRSTLAFQMAALWARTVLVAVMLSLALAARAESQASRWTLVGTTADTIYNVDSTVVSTSRDMIVAWTRAEFPRPIRSREGYRYDAREVRYRIDCRSSRWRGTESAYYRGNTLVRRFSGSGSARYYSPLWPAEREVLEVACEMAAQRRP